MANIFISYNRKSENAVGSLADDIKALGHDVWFDQELSGGKKWWEKILSMVRDCDVFVFVLDPMSLESKACKLEYGYAADLGKSILPVLVAEGVSTNLLPPTLSQIQFVDYRKQDRGDAFRLAKAIANIPSPQPIPDPLPSPPEAPISYLGSLSEQVETTSTLSYKEQSALLVDLKRSLRDPKNKDDTLTLLKKFRKRHDLFAKIAEEIDEFLGSIKETSSTADRVSKTMPSSTKQFKKGEASNPLERENPKQFATQPTSTETDHEITKQKKVKGALILTVAGIIAAILSNVIFLILRGALEFLFHDLMRFAWVYFALGGGIAGFISGMDKRGIASALIGKGVPFILASFAFYPGSFFVQLPALFAPSMGVLVGLKLKGGEIRRNK